LDDPVRVLFVNDLRVGEGGGAEVVLGRQVDALREAGHEVHVWAGEVSHGGIGKALDVWDPFARRAFRSFAERVRPDVVHHHNVLRELSVSVLGVPTGTPQVLTAHDERLLGVHDQQWHGARALVARAVKDPLDQRTVRRRVDAVAAVSAGLTARLVQAGFPARHLTVPGPPGVSAGPAPSASMSVLYLGRLDRDKGFDVLLQAWPAVRREHPSAWLVVAGDGPLRPEGVEGVQALGRVAPADVADLLSAARVVVVPSVPSLRPEGSPLVAVEAAWAGRPLVVSDDPGLVELSGWLTGTRVVPAGSSAALAAALSAALASGSAADAEGRANLAGFARHAPDRCAADLVDLYASLL
jgi:glycosyltransferase involved in cell wall biosynthesis